MRLGGLGFRVFWNPVVRTVGAVNLGRKYGIRFGAKGFGITALDSRCGAKASGLRLGGLGLEV